MNESNECRQTLNVKMRKCAETITSPDFDGNISKMCYEIGIARSTFYRWYDKKEFKDCIACSIFKRKLYNASNSFCISLSQSSSLFSTVISTTVPFDLLPLTDSSNSGL